MTPGTRPEAPSASAPYKPPFTVVTHGKRRRGFCCMFNQHRAELLRFLQLRMSFAHVSTGAQNDYQCIYHTSHLRAIKAPHSWIRAVSAEQTFPSVHPLSFSQLTLPRASTLSGNLPVLEPSPTHHILQQAGSSECFSYHPSASETHCFTLFHCA